MIGWITPWRSSATGRAPRGNDADSPRRRRRRRRRGTFTRFGEVRHLIAAFDLQEDKI